MQKRLISVAAAVGMLAACAPEPTLTPAPQTQPAPGMSGGATASDAGVSLSAWAQEWSAEPTDLANEVTPILVRLENNGTSPVMIRLNHFKLLNPTGDDFAAMPPFAIDETVTKPVTVMAYPFSGFYIAPYLNPFYPSLSPFADPFLIDQLYYDTHLTAFRTLELPTGEMMRLALPEGVLEPGGAATGFVYFEDITDDPMQVTLDLDLMTPDGDNFGHIQIPFRVEE